MISGTGSVRLLIRAVGPGLAGFGVQGALADPTVTLYRGSTVLATNDNWSSAANASEISSAATAVGAFALTSGSRDAAILTSLPAGSYTAVVSGVGNDMFEPDRDITRAEFAAIVVRALGLKPGMGNNPFLDVGASEWYCEYIQTASEYGIISGYGNGKFGPNDKITREQAMTMAARAMKITGLEAGLAADDIDALLTGFEDLGQVASWAKENIAACVKTGIVSGKSDKLLAPKDEITRAEVVVIVRRLLQKSSLI